MVNQGLIGVSRIGTLFDEGGRLREALQFSYRGRLKRSILELEGLKKGDDGRRGTRDYR